jgi:hypothetical protein
MMMASSLKTTAKTKRTIYDVLRLANDKGEIGYAYGEGDKELPLIEELVERDWARFGSSYYAHLHLPRHQQQLRAVYYITAQGREALKRKPK